MSRLGGILLAAAILYVLFHASVVIALMQSEVFRGEAYPIDFAVFWGAAKLALDGQAIAAFDRDVLYAVIQFPDDYLLPKHDWRYPPTWHMVIAPLGALPFTLAWCVFNAVGLAVFILALRPFAGGLPGQLSFVLASPAVVFCVITANNALLFVGILVFALRAIDQRQRVRAGFLIALLTLKPQMGVLIPFALAAGGHWRVLIWATVGAVVFATLAGMVLTFDYWAVFFSNLVATSQRLTTPEADFATFTTWFGFVRMLGLDTALGVTLCASVIGAVLIGWVWTRPIALQLKAGVLLLAIPVLSPYGHYYEITYTLAGMAILYAHGAMRGWVFLIPAGVIWILPALVTYVREPPVFLWLAAPTLTVLVLLAVRDVTRRAT